MSQPVERYYDFATETFSCAILRLHSATLASQCTVASDAELKIHCPKRLHSISAYPMTRINTAYAVLSSSATIEMKDEQLRHGNGHWLSRSYALQTWYVPMNKKGRILDADRCSDKFSSRLLRSSQLAEQAAFSGALRDVEVANAMDNEASRSRAPFKCHGRRL